MKNLLKTGLVLTISLLMVACSSNKIINESEAKSVALKDTGLKEGEVVFVSVNYSEDDKEYNIKFNSETYMFEYDINANSGKIESKDSELINKTQSNGAANEPSNDPATSEAVYPNNIKSAVLVHFSLGEVEVMNYYEEEDYKDNGTKVIDVSFIYEGVEYDAEVDPTTLAILESSRDND